MKRRLDVQIAHDALSDIDRKRVLFLVDSVNLSAQEKVIIIKSEIEKVRISELADYMALSADSIMRIKTHGMQKIAQYIKSTEIIQ